MSAEKIENYITSNLLNVQQSAHFGYTFFFYGSDHVLPFVTIAHADNEYDNVSNLSREGIFRVNIGVSKVTFNNLFPDLKKEWDFTETNVFMSQPSYASQHFICVLNPVGDKLEETLRFIQEAHAIAKNRFDKKQLKKSN
ncbi:DUF6194 family protein [Olivibacter jilunii]|uniref:DUF6194 family protein n=1 Tax=Olivibacter jilunii TaxID=985016 RepID=UPI003F142245